MTRSFVTRHDRKGIDLLRQCIYTLHHLATKVCWIAQKSLCT